MGGRRKLARTDEDAEARGSGRRSEEGEVRGSWEAARLLRVARLSSEGRRPVEKMPEVGSGRKAVGSCGRSEKLARSRKLAGSEGSCEVEVGEARKLPEVSRKCERQRKWAQVRGSCPEVRGSCRRAEEGAGGRGFWEAMKLPEAEEVVGGRTVAGGRMAVGSEEAGPEE
ncbi:hypothetical protein FNV43_RR21394 [Rhamnella rubrinervis]|uniref:Uncharacterized protein n=1 Tax=Rhamnella rubrinervis TaxID=2594499 RepID=A0A8K0E1L2_9ROSA|nr:hypothetical protein FNV43_RR21394 [Rhamnella rubrinervis]